ncbi:MAG: GlsB/YeaQ/YmgE family stress response membrane protein [Actinobacteria bacterium]|nr:GlsB/YeaQ/YmgE family stress response membrane protein [Actinomycetota bacterium]
MLIFALLGIAAIAGFIAQMIVGRNRGRTNWGEALVAGFIGSFVGGLLASLIAGDGLRFRPSGVIGSIVGAIVVLLVWGGVRGRSAA